jgi:ribosomal protein S18 acetylase RimI-like enzyme
VSSPRIRRELRPGDYGAIVELHGRLYAREYGLDSSFEAHVAAGVTRAAMRGFPGQRERLWVVEHEGAFAGSLGLTDEDGVTGVIRWVLLDPSVRGMGLGRRLVGEAVAHARELGYERLELETFADLTTAAAIYRSNGFRLASEEVAPRWGRESLNYQNYELDLSGVDESAARPSDSSMESSVRGVRT